MAGLRDPHHHVEQHVDQHVDQHVRDPRRARAAARHAERLYPGPLGRLVAHELLVWAEDPRSHRVGDHRGARPAAASLLRSSELTHRSRTVT